MLEKKQTSVEYWLTKKFITDTETGKMRLIGRAKPNGWMQILQAKSAVL